MFQGGAQLRKAGLYVLLGSVGGYGVGLLLTPVLARLVTPEDFGVFATIVSVASVFVGVSTLRLEILAQREHRSERQNLLAAANTISLSAAILVGILVVAGWLLGLWPSIWLVLPLLIALGSAQLVAGAVLTSEQSYKQMGIFNAVMGSATAVIQVVLAWLYAAPLSLIVGTLAGRTIWLSKLPRADLQATRDCWPTHKRNAIRSGSSALINSLAGQLQILLPAVLYGATAAGIFGMAVRLLSAPLMIIAQAVAAAAVGEIGRALRSNTGSALRVAKSGMVTLLLVGATPCAIVMIAGPSIFEALLGSKWRQAGDVARALSLGVLAQFIAAPFSQVLNLTGRSGRLLIWDVSRLASIATAFTLPLFFNMSISAMAWLVSAAYVGLYVALAILTLRALSIVQSES